MPAATWVLMNCDLVAVPLQMERGAVVTIYCGERRANQLLPGSNLGYTECFSAIPAEGPRTVDLAPTSAADTRRHISRCMSGSHPEMRRTL
jgi:hypothetical protein